MTDFTHLMPDEKAIVKALDPNQAIIRTINWDHEGNIHVLLKFDHTYVKNLGITKNRLDTTYVAPDAKL